MSDTPKALNRYIAITLTALILFTAVCFIFFKQVIISHLKEENGTTLEKNHVYATSTLTFLSQSQKKGDRGIQIELARSSAEQIQGLSGRTSLAVDHGMLFVFEKSDIYGFWMPDMLFPIDIVWISEEKKIVHIEKNVSPASYPQVFKPTDLAQYVLEVPAGFCDTNSVVVGNSVAF